MTLRPEYALGQSPYNAFLFAAVGEEQSGVPLTVLSALARLGFDPWQEAARLADLPRETAARVFAVTIAMLPAGDWKASDVEAISARLVNALPLHGSLAAPRADPPAETAGGAEQKKPNVGFARTLVWAVLVAAMLVFAVNLFSRGDGGFNGDVSVSAQP
jgi:hypothetical protein